MTPKEYAIDRMRIAVEFLRSTSAGSATMVWDGVECDGGCLADELEAAAADLEDNKE